MTPRTPDGGEVGAVDEHLWLSAIRRHPRGEVRLYVDGRLICGTAAYQVSADVDARVAALAEAVEGLAHEWRFYQGDLGNDTFAIRAALAQSTPTTPDSEPYEETQP